MSNFNEAAEAKRHIGFAEMNDLDPKNLLAIGKWCCLTVTALCLSALALRAGAQQPTQQPQAPGYHIETTPLQGAATEGVGITQLPLEVDMDLAEKFVRIGFGSQVFGQRGFQSTNFLTPPLSTTQAAQLVLVVPAYGPFKGPAISEGIKRFAGRVMSVEFGREGSPVLYIQLPYWTHQREGPIAHHPGTLISRRDNDHLVEELRKVFVDELGAEEFGPDSTNERNIRIWWHH